MKQMKPIKTLETNQRYRPIKSEKATDRVKVSRRDMFMFSDYLSRRNTVWRLK